jgi:hypothetical protein
MLSTAFQGCVDIYLGKLRQGRFIPGPRLKKAREPSASQSGNSSIYISTDREGDVREAYLSFC